MRRESTSEQEFYSSLMSICQGVRASSSQAIRRSRNQVLESEIDILAEKKDVSSERFDGESFSGCKRLRMAEEMVCNRTYIVDGYATTQDYKSARGQP